MPGYHVEAENQSWVLCKKNKRWAISSALKYSYSFEMYCWYLTFHNSEGTIPFCLGVASYAWWEVPDRSDHASPALSGCLRAARMICSHSRKMCSPRGGEREQIIFWKEHGLLGITLRIRCDPRHITRCRVRCCAVWAVLGPGHRTLDILGSALLLHPIPHPAEHFISYCTLIFVLLLFYPILVAWCA